MYSLTIILLGIAPTALMFIVASGTGRQKSLHPFNVLAWTLLLGYTLKSLYLAYAVTNDAPFAAKLLSKDIIPLGQIGVCVGIIGFILGVFVFGGKHNQVVRHPRRITPPKTPEFYYYPIFFLSVGLMVTYFFTMGFHNQILSGKFSATKFFIDEEGGKSSLAFLTFGGDFVVVYFLYWLAFAKKINFANIYVPAIGFISLCYMIASRRNGVLIIIITTLMVLGIRTLNEPAMAKIKRWGGLVLVITALSFVSSIRQGGGEKSIAELSITDAFRASMEHSFEGAYFLDPAKTAAIIDQTQKKDLFMYGESFAGAFVAPVPRILWPDKPLVRIGPLVAQVILQYNNNSGAPPGAVGEFYMNFGWPGIVGGMFILGAMSAVFFNRYERSPDKRFTRPAYALYMLCIIMFLTADFSLSFLYFIRYGVAIWICTQFWRKMAAKYDPKPARSAPSVGRQPALAAAE